MPFTLAHPAIVLPLTRLPYRLSLTALAAGSMVPDFEFFLQMRAVENIGHKWYGIFLFDFPLALLFCFLFHNLLKGPLISNLPAFYKNRFIPMVGFNWNQYAKENPVNVVVSIFAGIATHIFWDGFTHFDGLFVEWFPLLQMKTGWGKAEMPVYFLLQILFSLLGMAVLQKTVHALPENINPTAPEADAVFWPLYAASLAVILLIRLAGWPQYNSFWGVFMAVMGGICYAWLLVSFFTYFFSPKKLSK